MNNGRCGDTMAEINQLHTGNSQVSPKPTAQRVLLGFTLSKQAS